VVYTKIGLGQIPPFSFTFLRFAIASLCILHFFLKNLPKPGQKFLQSDFIFPNLSFNIIVFPSAYADNRHDLSNPLRDRSNFCGCFFILSFIWKGALAKNLWDYFGLCRNSSNYSSSGNKPWKSLRRQFSGQFNSYRHGSCTSLYNTLSKKFQKQYAPLQLTAIFIFTTTVLLAFLAGFELLKNPAFVETCSYSSFWRSSLRWPVWNGHYYVLTQYIIKHASPLIASLMFYLLPISAFCLGIPAFGRANYFRLNLWRAAHFCRSVFDIKNARIRYLNQKMYNNLYADRPKDRCLFRTHKRPLKSFWS